MRSRVPSLLTTLLLAASLGTAACDRQPEDLQAGDGTPPIRRGADTTQIAGNLSEDFQQIAGQILPAVVSISTQSGRQQMQMPDDENHRFGGPQEPSMPDDGVGSGVIVDADKGYVLTNNHVVDNAKRIQITLQNGKRYNAKVVGTDPPTDLAVLQLDKHPALKAAVLGDSNRLRVGEWVLAIGSPFGLDSTVTAGIISAKGRADVGVADFEDFIQTDAAINPGNSGGALVNIKGELIGINTAIATRTAGYMGIGFAIPSSMIRIVMQELIAKGKVTRSQLGVYIGPLDEDLRLALKVPGAQQGIVVMDVIADTPAAGAGFQKYDLIVSLNGQPVSQVQAFRNQIALTPPGQKVKVEILREGKKNSLEITLREMPADAAGPPGGLPSPSRLGFTATPLTPEQAQLLQLPAGVEGLLVSQIDNTSTAWKRGLRQGDLITEINRKPVRSLEDVEPALSGLKPGDAVLLQIVRNGEGRILAFELPE
ncbi:MAG: Do family serine endopeptidase [Candidatus Sericytochromatia bacterium]